MRYELLTLALAAMLAISVGMVAADAPTEHEAESIDLDEVDLELVDTTDTSTIGFDDVDLEIVDNTDESDGTVEETEIGLDDWEVEEQAIDEIGPDQYTFSDEAEPGVANLHGTFAWSEGDTVEIPVQWTPTDQDIVVGIIDLDQGDGPAEVVSDGADVVELDVPADSDEWTVFIGNPDENTDTVFYTGSVES